MAWAKLATNTLTGTTDPITITGFTAKKFMFHISHELPTTTRIQPKFEFNNDTGSNYAHRFSVNGGTDITATSTDHIRTGAGTNVDWELNVGYIINIASEEKLDINFCIYGSDASTNAPNRQEAVSKWANTSNQITEIDDKNGDTGDYGGFATGSNLTVLTGDETETVTLQNGTIFEESDTNKAYIWNASTKTWTQL